MRNEYQDYLLRLKAADAYDWLPYLLHVPIVSQSGSLNLLEPYGPVISLYRDYFIFTLYLKRLCNSVNSIACPSPCEKFRNKLESYGEAPLTTKVKNHLRLAVRILHIWRYHTHPAPFLGDKKLQWNSLEPAHHTTRFLHVPFCTLTELYFEQQRKGETTAYVEWHGRNTTNTMRQSLQQRPQLLLLLIASVICPLFLS